MARHEDGRLVIEDVQRLRSRPAGVQKLVIQTAHDDPPGTRTVIPQDPGQAGVDQIDNYARLLVGHDCRFRRVHGDKETRAQPLSAQCEAGMVTLVRAKWNEPFLQALEAFPEEGMHDDDVDAAADAFNETANVLTLGAAPVVSGTRRIDEQPDNDDDEDEQSWRQR
jgi:predicted phage terminase large subunit-like protein